MSDGNTPTGVGKTIPQCETANRCWKHPHRRGEDSNGRAPPDVVLETPPQAWGRRLRRDSDDGQDGNTPTGVGKTIPITP